ncbi:MAG: LuxR C-terminal-related transcriptional regulator [Flavisolibacter sp.]
MGKIQLNEIEIKIIKLICRQFTAKEIAEKLGYSFRTVEDYRNKIEKKIAARNVVGIALYAIKHGIYKL